MENNKIHYMIYDVLLIFIAYKIIELRRLRETYIIIHNQRDSTLKHLFFNFFSGFTFCETHKKPRLYNNTVFVLVKMSLSRPFIQINYSSLIWYPI